MAKLREIEPKVLALAQSLGTPPTLAGLEIQKQGELARGPRDLVVGLGRSTTRA